MSKCLIGDLVKRTKYAYIREMWPANEAIVIRKYKLRSFWRGKKIPKGATMLIGTNGEVFPAGRIVNGKRKKKC